MPTTDAIASGVVGNATTDGPALFLHSRLFNTNGHAVAFRKPRLIVFRLMDALTVRAPDRVSRRRQRQFKFDQKFLIKKFHGGRVNPTLEIKLT